MSDRLILILMGVGGGGGGLHTNLCRNFFTSSQTLTWRLYNEPDQTKPNRRRWIH